MKILRMTASFGRLNNETLELQDGLNILHRANESGKSTWSQFILAMFYGVDTSERAKSGTLPAKTKYKPWSGAPMQGSMELEWNGKHITIERTSSGRGLMNQFRAYETGSGLNVSELTAENCGVVLLGAERSVFERSAFIRQTGIAVTRDGALEQRLQALVTTGDEGASFSEAERLLKDRRNYLGRARTGRLDHLTAELEQVQAGLSELDALSKAVMDLSEEEQRLSRQQADLERQLSLSEARENAKKSRQLAAAAAQKQEKAASLQAAEQAVQGLPTEETLSVWQQCLTSLPPEPNPVGDAPTAPKLPEAFRGMDAAQIRENVQKDLAVLGAPEVKSRIYKVLLIAFEILAAAGLVIQFFNLPVGLALVVLGLIGTIYPLLKIRKTNDRNKVQQLTRSELLQKYNVANSNELLRLSERCCAELELYDRQKLQYEASCAAYTEAVKQRDDQITALLSEIGASSLSEANEKLRDARAALDALRRAQMEADQANQYYVNLRSAFGDLPETPPALLTDEPLPAPEALRQQLNGLAVRQTSLRSQLDQNQGRRSAVGDPAELNARSETLSEQVQTVKDHCAALDAAMAALSAANREVQTRISPALAQKAGEYMAFLTDDRYDKVQLASDFSAFARLTGDSVQRELAYLSAGTADQLYLSVRLAICALTLSASSAPLILDDALVSFDDERCKRALSLLRQLAEDRQILLFTCHSREESLSA